jgi:hypothetical protein
MIGLQAAQGFLQHAQGNFFIAAVGADFGHDERLIAFPFQCLADAVFTEAVVIFPGVVEKCDAVVEGFGDDFHRRLLGFGGAEMVAAESHGRDLDAGAAQRLFRYLPFGDLL